MPENQPDQPTTTIPQAETPSVDPEKKQSPCLAISLAVLILILLGTTGLFAYQNYQLKQQVSQNQPTSLPVSTKQPEVSSPTPIGNTLKTEPVTNPSAPPATNKINLTYTLKSGWETITDTSNSLQVGYNPTTMQAAGYKASISITTTSRFEPIRQITYANVRLGSYDGGSRHDFIYEQLNSIAESMKLDRMENYYEVEYNYDGKSCLVLYNQGFSAGGTTWGMCDISPTQAIFIESSQPQSQAEEIIQTIKAL